MSRAIIFLLVTSKISTNFDLKKNKFLIFVINNEVFYINLTMSSV